MSILSSGLARSAPKAPHARLEEALIAWATCGPNGLVAWDISMDGGFHELTRAGDELVGVQATESED
jgi:hypothetical protein